MRMDYYELKSCPFCGAPMNYNASTGEIIGWHKDDCFFCWLEEDERDMTLSLIHI